MGNIPNDKREPELRNRCVAQQRTPPASIPGSEKKAKGACNALQRGRGPGQERRNFRVSIFPSSRNRPWRIASALSRLNILISVPPDRAPAPIPKIPPHRQQRIYRPILKLPPNTETTAQYCPVPQLPPNPDFRNLKVPKIYSLLITHYSLTLPSAPYSLPNAAAHQRLHPSEAPADADL